MYIFDEKEKRNVSLKEYFHRNYTQKSEQNKLVFFNSSHFI